MIASEHDLSTGLAIITIHVHDLTLQLNGVKRQMNGRKNSRACDHKDRNANDYSVNCNGLGFESGSGAIGLSTNGIGFGAISAIGDFK